MLVHTPFITLISWFIMWLTSHAIILCCFFTLISCFIKRLNICPVHCYTFYHTTSLLHRVPHHLYSSYLCHHTTSLLNWLPHHLYSSYPFYHTAFFALPCASPFVLIFHTFSITLPSLLHRVPHHLYSSYQFYHAAFVAALSASPFVLFIPVLSHCFLCFTVCLTICADTSYQFYHAAFFAALSASPFILLAPIVHVSQFFPCHFDTKPLPWTLNLKVVFNTLSSWCEINTNDIVFDDITVESRCNFKPVPNSYPRYLDIVLSLVSDETDCERRCFEYSDLICRSFSYYPSGSQCFISGDDRGQFSYIVVDLTFKWVY